MTAHNDLDRQLTDFLREGPEELPYESFDAVRDRTERTGQRVFIGPWRLPEMNKTLTFGLVTAALVVAAFVGAQLFGSPNGGFGSDEAPAGAEPPGLAGTGAGDPPSEALRLARYWPRICWMLPASVLYNSTFLPIFAPMSLRAV